jgi:hypothetical protein
VVKVQKDNRVIDTGPYAFVRHPMYASTLFLFIGIPLLLGSRPGLVFAAFFIAAIAWRAVHEERHPHCRAQRLCGLCPPRALAAHPLHPVRSQRFCRKA